MLPYAETVYLKWGSNVVSMKAKRSIRHRLSTLVGRRSLSSAGKGKNGKGVVIGGVEVLLYCYSLTLSHLQLLHPEIHVLEYTSMTIILFFCLLFRSLSISR